ncbi:MAG: LysM peptidoglycan-binding domain-containing M23 family metallopeptidase, partial [Rhodospirillaceae bacterium]|nr:LysM peptidoglycan-binding domain-containing M23 family metallopeptidase [Rhodospirillaceae bacterium]
GLATALAACGPVTQPVTGAYSQPSAGSTVAPAARPSRLGLTYTVQSGDTLYSIARRADLGIRTVIEANGLKPPYVLIPGRVLDLPRLQEHVVQPGDTLYAVSRRYGIQLSELVRANAIPEPYTIRVGERLVLPGQARRAAQTASPAPTGLTESDLPAPGPGPGAKPGGLAPPVDLTAKPPAPSATAAAAKPSPPPSAATAAVVAPPVATGRGFLWPVNGRIVSNFGPKKGGENNDGVNIEAPRGSPVMAVENGVVAYSGNELRGFGNLLLIRHDDGWVSAYAHNDDLLVSRGDQVQRGQRIATVGSTGSVGSPQLHFELRHKSRAIDPRTKLPSQVSAR